MSIFALQITEWYRQNKRDLPWRFTNDPYKIWLSEVILQQTRVDQGLPYYSKFCQYFPDLQALASADEEEVLNCWKGLGYYSRARNLHSTAKFIVNSFNASFPDSYSSLICLKGIGPYTAAAIASFAFNEKVAVLDGNVFRVLSRYFGIDTPVDTFLGKKAFQTLANTLIDDLPADNQIAEYNQGIMEFGALQCKPKNPNCENCMLCSSCASYAAGKVEERPLKEKKVKSKKRYFHYLFFKQDDKTIIVKRMQKDIWAGMYDFPLIETDQPELPLNLLNKIEVDKISGEILHHLTHQKITAVFYHIERFPEQLEDNWIVVNTENLSNYPMSRLLEKYLESQEII
jgi:A/G-specific adenine glycosylase